MKNFLLSIPAFFAPVIAHASVGDTLNKIADKIPLEGAIIVGAGFVLELVLRFVKTDKPLSILTGVAYALHGLANVSEKLADVLDQVLGQRAGKK